MIKLPIIYNPYSILAGRPILSGATWEELAPFHSPLDPIRQIEKASIRTFVECAAASGYFTGRVMDFGAGKPGTCTAPEPYRDLITGEYVPIDLGDLPSGKFDTILMTQVIQYLSNPAETLTILRQTYLKPGGTLVLTGPTNWPEVEDTDLSRYTLDGIWRMLQECGFIPFIRQHRAHLIISTAMFSLGYGVIARNSL